MAVAAGERNAIAPLARVRAHQTKTKTKTVTLARVALKVVAATTNTVHLKLGRSARAVVLAAGRRGLAVRLTATVRDANGISATTSVATTLTRARH